MTVRVLALASGATTLESHRLGLAPLSQSSAQLDRRSGIYPGYQQAELATVSAMVCSISPFFAYIDGTSSTTQGGYSFCADATTNITFDNGNVSTARTDRIIARVKDDVYDGSGSTTGEVAYWKGNTTTGAATALPAGSLLLWEVVVPAGTTAGGGGINFTSAKTDCRTYTATAGGIIRTDSSAQKTGVTNPYEGLVIARSDKDWLELRTGTKYKVVGPQQFSNLAALTAEITSPDEGDIHYLADVNYCVVYDGANWVPVTHRGNPACIVRRVANQSINDTTFTAMAFDTQDVDTDAMFAPTDSKVYAPVAGIYSVGGYATETGGSSGFIILELKVNGTAIVNSQTDMNASGALRLSISDNLYLTAGQYAELVVYQASSGARNFTGRLSMVLSRYM